MDPYVRERWSQFQSEMMKECEVLSQIHQSLQSLKSEGADVDMANGNNQLKNPPVGQVGVGMKQ